MGLVISSLTCVLMETKNQSNLLNTRIDLVYVYETFVILNSFQDLRHQNHLSQAHPTNPTSLPNPPIGDCLH